jgi:hypothetical protein
MGARASTSRCNWAILRKRWPVVEEAPLLETSSASAGRVIDHRQVMELPYSDINPYALRTPVPAAPSLSSRRPTRLANSGLDTANFNASFGDTSGATVNFGKSGTNQLHGAVYDQHWQRRWNATQHFARLAWEDNVRTGKLSHDSQKQQSGRSNMPGATIGARRSAENPERPEQAVRLLQRRRRLICGLHDH